MSVLLDAHAAPNVMIRAVLAAHGRNASCDEQREYERRQKQKPLDHFDSSSLFIATISRPHFGHSSPKYPGGNLANTADLKTCANFPHGQAVYPLAICSGVSLLAVIAAPWLSVPSLRLSRCYCLHYCLAIPRLMLWITVCTLLVSGLSRMSRFFRLCPLRQPISAGPAVTGRDSRPSASFP